MKRTLNEKVNVTSTPIFHPKRVTLTFAIEVGLARKESFAKIAKQLRKHPHTIAREVKENRTHELKI